MPPLSAQQIRQFNRHAGELVRGGHRTGRVRCSQYEMALPEAPQSASFFDQQTAGR